MRRITTIGRRAALPLAIGAVLSIVTAWLIAGSSPFDGADQRTQFYATGGDSWYVRRTDVPGATRVLAMRDFKVSGAIRVERREPDSPRWGATALRDRRLVKVEAFGWPFRAMKVTFESSSIDLPLRTRPRLGGFEIDVDDWSNLNADSSRTLPLHPIGAGLAANALLFGLVIFCLVAAPRALRRWFRARRGRCTGCGYLLVGLARCPECGLAARRASGA